MKRSLNVAGGLLGLLVLVALIISLTLTFRGLQKEAKPASQVFQSPIETPTQPPYPPPTTPTPSGPPSTPTMTPVRVPICAFASRAEAVAPVPPLGAYQFSNPKVILTNKYGMSIRGWASDNRRLLVVRNGVPQKLDVFDTQTGEVITYAKREHDGPAFWLRDRHDKKEVVAYMKRKTVMDGQGASHFRYEVWMTRGPGSQPQLLFIFPEKRWSLASTIESGTAIDPVTGSLILFNGVKTRKPDFSSVVSQVFDVISLPADPFAWQPARDKVQPLRTPPLSAAKQPGGEFVAVYGYPHLFLYNVNTHQPCIVDLGHGPGPIYPLNVAWSPNGRFLAMIVTADDPRGLLHFSRLEVLDTTQGTIYHIDISAPIVTEIAWAPNNQVLLMLGEVEVIQGRPIQKLFLVDVSSQDTRAILPKITFGGGAAWGQQMAWNGHTVAIKCPVWLEDRPEIRKDKVCTILVETHP